MINLRDLWGSRNGPSHQLETVLENQGVWSSVGVSEQKQVEREQKGVHAGQFQQCRETRL